MFPPCLIDGWVHCGCCAGVERGGEYPRECHDCGGWGYLWRYASGRLALWPGGPFRGQESTASRHRPFDLDAAMSA